MWFKLRFKSERDDEEVMACLVSDWFTEYNQPVIHLSHFFIQPKPLLDSIGKNNYNELTMLVKPRSDELGVLQIVKSTESGFIIDAVVQIEFCEAEEYNPLVIPDQVLVESDQLFPMQLLAKYKERSLGFLEL